MTRSSTLAQRVQITITDEGSDHSNSVSSLSSSELDAHGVNVDIEDDSAEESDEESEVESDQSKGAMPWSNDSTTAYLEQESGFHWDQLPGECRNKIYRYLMRSQRPLKLQHLGSLPSSSWGKPFQLSAQFLRCSASIYNEALPILLGENAFTLWNNLSEIIGKGATRRKREPLIRRLVIETTQVERVINKIRMKELGALKNLKKVEFESRSLGVTLKDMFRDDWEKTAREALGDLPHQLKDLMKLRPDVEYFYFDEGMVPAPPGKVRSLEIKLNPSLILHSPVWRMWASSGRFGALVVSLIKVTRRSAMSPRRVLTKSARFVKVVSS